MAANLLKSFFRPLSKIGGNLYLDNLHILRPPFGFGGKFEYPCSHLAAAKGDRRLKIFKIEGILD